MVTNRCVSCGADISHRGIRAQRCEACAEKRSKRLERLRRGGSGYVDGVYLTKSNPQCEGCRFLSPSTGVCDYFAITGHTRTSLHVGDPTDWNNPCREREVGTHEKVPFLQV